jgi:TonB family protein
MIPRVDFALSASEMVQFLGALDSAIVVTMRITPLSAMNTSPRAVRAEQVTVGRDEPSAYSSSEVERQAAPLPGNRPAEYPAMLRAANVSGEVVLRFVVDTSGRADSSTIRVLQSTHSLFTAAARDALIKMRFQPAERSGRPVRQVAQMPFHFSLSGKP